MRNWVKEGCTIAEYNSMINSKMGIRKWKLIKNTIQVGVLLLHSVFVSYLAAQSGYNPTDVAVVTLVVIGALIGIEWAELPSIEVVNRVSNDDKDNGGE